MLTNHQVLSEINRIMKTHQPHKDDVCALRDFLRIARERGLDTNLGDGAEDLPDERLFEERPL